ncbi:MAG: CusA/CzcA family heavy metal efflux RND transporter [Planctomycetota bacterium]|nr:CusA/CzcA family heavy metal efflux RND transporter [Planctomycetota bacterium]
MLEKIIAWSLTHRLMVLGGAFVVALAGWFSLRALNIDAFPDTTPVQIQINTVAPALVPEEIERQVTFPVEMAMGGLPGLESLRSVSQFGLSQVIVTFKDGTNVYFARQLINERLGSVETPVGVAKPEMGPVSTGLGEVFHYVLIPENGDLTAAKTLHDWQIKPEMRTVPGTAEINSWGGLKKQYQVRLDPVKLLRHDLTFEEVLDALSKSNLNVGGGNIRQGGDSVLVHGVGRTANIDEIQGIVIKASDGKPIKIRDVADVVVSHEMRRGIVTANGQGEVVLGLGFMLMGENSYAVTNRLRNKYNEVRENLPTGMKMEVVYDRTSLVNRVIDTVKNNLAEGAFLVVILLFILLGNLRAGLIAAAAIPLSMLFGFCGMWYAGIAGSLLSLGAIDFGIVVDSSVLVIENIIKRLAHHGECTGQERLRVVRDAASEVRIPTVFGQLIIMIVYLPILSLEGVEGKMFRPMALTVIFILTGSLILSLTMTPVLASLVLPKKVEEHEVFVVRAAQWLYRPALAVAFRFRMLLLLLAGCALAVALKIALGLGSEFVPRLSEGDLVIGVLRAPGTSLEESAAMNTRMEAMLLEKYPDEVSHVWSRVGAPEVATDAGNLEVTDMFVSLKPREQWRQATNQTELVEKMVRDVDEYRGQLTWFTQPIELRINEMVSGVRADVALKLFGDDFDTLIPKAGELQNVLAGIEGCSDLSVEQITGQPILRITLRPEELARYGLSARTVLDLVEAIGSKVVGEVVEGQLRFPLVARLPEEFRENPEAIGAIPLSAPGGEQVPLARVADIKRLSGPKMITREWSRRRITVQCNVRGRDVGSFVKEAQQRIAEQVEIPRDKFRVEWGGQFENMQRAQRRLMIVVPVALFLILGLLYLTYRSPLDTILVFASVPFACIGGIIAVALREMPLSISAAVGFITLSGVSVLSSMVLMSAWRASRETTNDRFQLVRDVSVASLRTIVMTALVASVGFIPMAVSQGSGAEVQRPLATVVIGGVITSALFTLVVLPILLSFRRTGSRVTAMPLSSVATHAGHGQVVEGQPA